MTDRDDFELRLQQFFGEGPNEIEDAVIEASLLEIATTGQRRRVGKPTLLWVPDTHRRLLGAVAAVAVLAIVVTGAAGLLARPASTGVTPPSTAMPAESAAPSACVRDAVLNGVLSQGCRWRFDQTAIPMSVDGREQWVLEQEDAAGFAVTLSRREGAGLRIVLRVVDVVPVTPCVSARAQVVDVEPAPAAVDAYVARLRVTPMGALEPVPVSIADEPGLRIVYSGPAVPDASGATAPPQPAADACAYLGLDADPVGAGAAGSRVGGIALAVDPRIGHVIDVLRHDHQLIVIDTSMGVVLDDGGRRTANVLLEGLRFER